MLRFHALCRMPVAATFVIVASVVLACSGQVETAPGDDENEDNRRAGGANDPGTSGGAVNGGEASSGGSTNSSGGASPVGAGGSLPTGPITGEFHLTFAGEPMTNSNTMGVITVTIVTLPENATVTASLDGYEVVTGVAGSMTFLIKDCIDLEDGTEECVLDVVSFGGSPSGNGADIGVLAFDGRLTTYAKQETFTTTVIKDGNSWSLPDTYMGLVLDAGTVQGAYEDQNDTGSGPPFITVSNPTGETSHELIIESFSASCAGDDCQVDFSAYERAD